MFTPSYDRTGKVWTEIVDRMEEKLELDTTALTKWSRNVTRLLSASCHARWHSFKFVCLLPLSTLLHLYFIASYLLLQLELELRGLGSAKLYWKRETSVLYYTGRFNVNPIMESLETRSRDVQEKTFCKWYTAYNSSN